MDVFATDDLASVLQVRAGGKRGRNGNEPSSASSRALSKLWIGKEKKRDIGCYGLLNAMGKKRSWCFKHHKWSTKVRDVLASFSLLHSFARQSSLPLL